MANKMISAALLALASLGTAANAEVRITEFMYQGFGGGSREFFELTNISTTAVDVSGWTYNDNNLVDTGLAFGTFFGSLGANESVIFTEMTADAFRTYWSLDAGVRIFTLTSSNLGSEDTINIYSSTTQTTANLVDSVTYAGTTRGVSRNRPDVAGPATNAQFLNSTSGDAYGSRFAGPVDASDLGNPGSFPFTAAAAVPEPATWGLMIGGFGLMGGTLRRRRSAATPAWPLSILWN